MLTAFLGFGFWAISCYALLALFGMTDGDDEEGAALAAVDTECALVPAARQDRR